MSDIKTVWNIADSVGDWVMDGSDLQSGDDLATAVFISIFTDRLALTGDKTDDGDRRGWWGDGQTNKIGSRLWLLYREKATSDIPLRAKNYIAEAIQWLIDDGAVASFDITAEWTRSNTLGAKITANRHDGQKIAINYPNIWQRTI